MASTGYVELPDTVPHLHPGYEKKKRPISAGRPLEITLGVRRTKDLPDLSALDPLPPAERPYLTHADLETKYGSDPDAVARIRRFAEEHGLKVTEQPVAARVRLAGFVGNLTRAFKVTLHDHVHPTGRFRFHAHTEPISVPRALFADITGVFGFNSQRCLRRIGDLVNVSPAVSPAARPRLWFWPPELAKIYNFPQVRRHSETIALLEFGGHIVRRDLTAYFRKIRRATPEVQVIRVNPIPACLRRKTNYIREVMLDTEVAGALSPGARIAVYFSMFDEKGLIDALSAVISDTINKPSVVSISWGYSENQKFGNNDRWSQRVMEHVDQSFRAAALLGITVCAAAGDGGSEGDVNDGHAHVPFPATSPYVLAVGGTTLHVTNAAARRPINEIVWNTGRRATGGGVSDVTPRPVWQTSIKAVPINPGQSAGRAIPDVAANADRATGYCVRVGGKLGVHGGTSAAAPLWASLIARLNSLLSARVGNINALLYSTYGPEGVFRDIRVGSNDMTGDLEGQFAAASGWDAASGWGAPDGGKLLAALKRAPKAAPGVRRGRQPQPVRVRIGRAQSKHH